MTKHKGIPIPTFDTLSSHFPIVGYYFGGSNFSS
jgi:hypothetical protein